MFSINDVWAVAYSPNLKIYRTVKLMQLMLISFAAHERKEDTDYVVIGLTTCNESAVQLCDEIERRRNGITNTP